MLVFWGFIFLLLYRGSVHIVASQGGSSRIGRFSNRPPHTHACMCTHSIYIHAHIHTICLLPPLKYHRIRGGLGHLKHHPAFVLGFPVLQSTCIHMQLRYGAGAQEWDWSTRHPESGHHLLLRVPGPRLPKVTRLVVRQGSHSNWQASLPTGNMVPSHLLSSICTVICLKDHHIPDHADPVRPGGPWAPKTEALNIISTKSSKPKKPWNKVQQWVGIYLGAGFSVP